MFDQGSNNTNSSTYVAGIDNPSTLDISLFPPIIMSVNIDLENE